MIKEHYPLLAADGDAGGAGQASDGAEGQTNDGAEGEGKSGAEGTEKPTFEELLKDGDYKDAIDKIVEQTKANLLKEQEEAARLEKLKPDEKLQEALDKAQRLEAENAAILLKNKTAGLLGEKKLPAEFLKFLTGSDEKTMRANVDAFEKAYTAAVAAAAKELVPGYTPRTGSGTEDATSAAMRRGAGLK